MDSVKDKNASGSAMVVTPGQRGRGLIDWHQATLSATENTSPTDNLLWLNLDWEDPESINWLTTESGLPEGSCQAALSENTRPRSFVDEDDNLVLILRVVNTEAAAQEARLVSLRLVISPGRIISLCHFRTRALQRFQRQLYRGRFQLEPVEVIGLLLRYIQEEIDEAVFSLNEELNQIETALEQGDPPLDVISTARKTAGQLQRYLAPQRNVLALMQKQVDWFRSAESQASWRELANALQLSLDEVQMASGRLLILQDELRTSLNEHSNRTLYLLSLVTFFFLPLSFITGFLGMNISFPWESSEAAFWVLLLLISGILLAQWWLIRKLKWL